jgi:phytoene dehydrogenase-like protein
MKSNHIVIIGGGLAGLSAACYALASGYRATIIEHNLALGGVCTAWSRGPYTIDGCIHWLTGGPFSRIYAELGILPKVGLHTLYHFTTYRHARDGFEIAVTRDLDGLGRALEVMAPEDAREIWHLIDAARSSAGIDPGIDQPPELMTLGDSLARFWEMRHQLSNIAHFRKSVGAWCADHIQNERLRRLLRRIVPDEMPALMLLFMFSFLAHGYLSRPDGGTGPFRDALIETFHQLGGQERLHATVDEVLVENGCACGVRLSDGTMMDADIVISTSSAPETVLRLLGGRYGAEDTRRRLQEWKLFEPIVLASYGVATPLQGVPPTLLIDGIDPFEIGGRTNDHLYIRIYNDDPLMAPAGHTVVQAIATTDYGWWATRGTRYSSEKDAIAEAMLERLEQHLPGLKQAVRVVDVSTPLTFWNMARSWRGSYEGWVPGPDAFFGHIKKTLPGLDRFYMAGQWVEPGGGVPTALMSGRQVMQLVCSDDNRPFVTPIGASRA